MHLHHARLEVLKHHLNKDNQHLTLDLIRVLLGSPHSLLIFWYNFTVMKVFLVICVYFRVLTALLIPEKLATRATSCENTATSRSCWGDYNIDTDYYDVTPTTGVTREVNH
jgi:hypothetical protein